MATVLLDRTFDALANHHRRDIVRRLTTGPVETPTLGAGFGMSKQALNRHIRVLEDAGLIERRRRGRVDELSLITESLDEVVAWVDHVRRGWAASLDRLATVLDELDETNGSDR